MIDQDEKVKLLNASTKGFDGKNHPEEDGSFPLDSRQGFTLHGALRVMIAHNEKIKTHGVSTNGIDKENCMPVNSSYPLDLMHGDTLRTACQIMIERDEKHRCISGIFEIFI